MKIKSLTKRRFLINFYKITLLLFISNYFFIKDNNNLLKLRKNKKFIWYLNEND